MSAQEILSISQDISANYSPQPDNAASELVLLPVDPHHIYAYWSIVKPGTTAPTPPTTADTEPLLLRVYWHPETNPTSQVSNIWFDIKLDNKTPRQKLRVPLTGTAYSAAIGKLDPDALFSSYAMSNTVHVPSDKPKPALTTAKPSTQPPFTAMPLTLQSAKSAFEQSALTINANDNINYTPVATGFNAEVMQFYSALSAPEFIRETANSAYRSGYPHPLTSSYGLNRSGFSQVR